MKSKLKENQVRAFSSAGEKCIDLQAADFEGKRKKIKIVNNST